MRFTFVSGGSMLVLVFHTCVWFFNVLYLPPITACSILASYNSMFYTCLWLQHVLYLPPITACSILASDCSMASCLSLADTWSFSTVICCWFSDCWLVRESTFSFSPSSSDSFLDSSVFSLSTYKPSLVFINTIKHYKLDNIFPVNVLIFHHSIWWKL